VPGLRRVRNERGYSQTELAALAGVSDYIVPRIEKGERTSLDTLGKLAAALRAESLEELLREDVGDKCHAEQEGELVAT
jgi:transcriptional regulator with XRE-family HTH domain